jgi:integrase
VPRIRPYDLRHTAASLLLASGVHPKIVAERLGHSTVNLTLNTYSHVLPGLQQEAADTMDRLLRQGSG